jgi:hypothetical protein
MCVTVHTIIARTRQRAFVVAACLDDALVLRPVSLAAYRSFSQDTYNAVG